MTQTSNAPQIPDCKDKSLQDKCGVFGVFGHPDAAALTALGLHALQHRGQEAAGIVSYDGEQFYSKRAAGLVDSTFSQKEVISRLKGYMAIGHNRYSTSGEVVMRNIQPLYADLAFGGFAIGQNGNLTNANTLRQEMVQQGALFQSTTDTEVFIHLIALSMKKTVHERMADAISQVKGGYAIVACAPDQLVAARDPHGIRPLCLGKLDDAHILASETCALDIIGAEFVRDVEPGEIITIDPKGVTSVKAPSEDAKRFCIFEYVYFSRPDSMSEGKSVYAMRKAIGEELAAESPVEGADIVVPVPDSGVPSAIGYAQASKLPFELGIIRNHYVGRTFIEPTDKIRHLGVKLKHNANRSFIEGKSVVLVDDSIVRGTTSKKIVDMVRQAGAREVHMRISSPPTTHSCFYGIDTPDTKDLLAHNHTTEDIRKSIGADTLAYISLDGLYRALGEKAREGDKRSYCDACFSGDYPVELTDFLANKTGKKITSLG